MSSPPDRDTPVSGALGCRHGFVVVHCIAYNPSTLSRGTHGPHRFRPSLRLRLRTRQNRARRDRHAAGLPRTGRVRRAARKRRLRAGPRRRAIASTAGSGARRGTPCGPHAGGPPARPDRRTAVEARTRGRRADDRQHRAEGPHPRARRGGARDRARARADRGRGAAGQAGQGGVLRHRPGAAAAQPGRRPPDRHRRDDGGLRAHDGARGERPRVRMPRAVGLRRLVLPRVPGGRPQNDRRAGGIFGWVGHSQDIVPALAGVGSTPITAS